MLNRNFRCIVQVYDYLQTSITSVHCCIFPPFQPKKSAILNKMHCFYSKEILFYFHADVQNICCVVLSLFVFSFVWFFVVVAFLCSCHFICVSLFLFFYFGIIFFIFFFFCMNWLDVSFMLCLKLGKNVNILQFCP